MKASKLRLTIFVTLCLVHSFPALGYGGAFLKCDYMSAIERVEFYKAVFSGEVLEVKKSGELEEVKFKVLKSWKYVRGNEVVVFNYPHHEAPHYELAKSYLVFASVDSGRLETHICSGTVEIGFAQKEMRQLDRWWRRNRAQDVSSSNARSPTKPCS